MGDLSATQEKILNTFRKVDFSLMPLHLAEIWARANSAFSVEERKSSITELGRFSEVVSVYDDYKETFRQKTSRDFKARDIFDLYTYMARNSATGDLTEDLAMEASNEYFSMYEETSLLSAYNEGATRIFHNQVAVHTFIWEQCSEIVSRVNEFRKTRHEDLSRSRDFIDTNHEYRKIRAIDLFDRLSMEDQHTITVGDWSRCPEDSYSPEFLIVTKMLFNYSLNAVVSRRHPYLKARRGNMQDIIETILERAGESERDMRILATCYSIVSDIKCSLLTEKCLIFKVRTR
jgi:hypothetical protein